MTDKIGIKQSELKSLPFVQLPILVLADTKLNSGDKVLYCALLRFAFQKGFCYPSVGRIGKLVGMSDSTTRRHLGNLVDRGLVKTYHRVGGTNVYDLCGIDEVYFDLELGGPGEVLSDDTLDDLEDAGEERLVDRIIDNRDEYHDTITQEDSGDENDKNEDRSYDDLQPVYKKKMVNSDIISEIEAKKEKSEAAINRRKERKKRLMSDPIQKALREYKKHDRIRQKGDILNVNDVEEEWILCMNEKWPDIDGLTQKWKAKEKGQANRLCKKHGHKSVVDMMRYVVKHWDSYCDRFNLTGYPNIGLFAYRGDLWISEIQSGVAYKENGIRNREYEDDGIPGGLIENPFG